MTTAEDAQRAERRRAIRAVVGGGGSRAAAFVVGNLLNVAAVGVLTRTLGDEYGRYTAVLSLITIVGIVSDLGLANLAVRELADDRGGDHVPRYRALVALRAVLVVPAAVGMVVYGALAGFSASLLAGTAVAAVGLVVYSLHYSWNAVLQAELQLHRLALIEGARQVLLGVLTIGLALAGASAAVLVAVYLPLAITMAWVSARAVRGTVPIAPLFDRRVMRSLLRTASVFAVATTAAQMYAYLGQVVSDAILDQTGSAEFALSFRVITTALGVAQTAISGAFAMMTRDAREDAATFRRTARNTLAFAAGLGLAGAVTCLAAAGLIVDVLGPDFPGAAHVLRLHAFALPGAFCAMAGAMLLLAAHRARPAIAIAIGVLVLSLAATAVFSSLWGPRGAAGAAVLGETTAAVLYAIALLAPRRPGRSG
ncbi:oligosaccharide flippase family protein [Patulibacter sp. SYSU D01012]|uniref:oligosaccharide flippase family protein n=1 Tax=Patulibacter sp. SYSU D01012 TaxID=2817381 RepID=UPI001B317DB0|nr:oligosaccharide flippase family protein [Patulibacter sp. SYSU D01012]